MLPLLLMLQTPTEADAPPSMPVLEKRVTCTLGFAELYAKTLTDAADLIAIAAENECNFYDNALRDEFAAAFRKRGLGPGDAAEQADETLVRQRQNFRDMAIAKVLSTRYKKAKPTAQPAR